jgi:hypothetical protein
MLPNLVTLSASQSAAEPGAEDKLTALRFNSESQVSELQITE